MRVAHFSDLHYAGATLTEVDRCFSFAVDAAIARGVDCAVISGDSTDHALEVHAPAVEALARNIRRLADHCPVLMLHGTFSHEPPGALNVFRLLGGRFRVHVADRLQQVALIEDGRWLESEGWRFEQIPQGARALFSCVPTVNKAIVAAAVGATEASAAVGEQLTALLQGYAPINEAARAAGVPTIGVSHGTVYGCVTEHGVPMAGFDHEFTTGSLFGAGAQAFLLGHIHKHQSWEQDGRVIAYAGSIGRLHYGEQGRQGIPDLGGRGGVRALRAHRHPGQAHGGDQLRWHAQAGRVAADRANQRRHRSVRARALDDARGGPARSRPVGDSRHLRRGRRSEARRGG